MFNIVLKKIFLYVIFLNFKSNLKQRKKSQVADVSLKGKKREQQYFLYLWNKKSTALFQKTVWFYCIQKKSLDIPWDGANSRYLSWNLV